MTASNLDVSLAVFVNLYSFFLTPFQYFLNSFISLIILIVYLQLIYTLFNKGIAIKNFIHMLEAETKIAKTPLTRNMPPANRTKNIKKASRSHVQDESLADINNMPFSSDNNLSD